MPTYAYECPKCGWKTETVRKIDMRDCATGCRCGADMKRIFSAPAGYGDLEPYFDENIVPVGAAMRGMWVTSKRHRRELMERHGLCEAYGKGWM